MAGEGVSKLHKFASDKFKPKCDDDAVDRLNYYWTGLVLGLFTLLIIGKQYVGQPIQCWIPAEFKGQWEKYSENYCFVENTYWVPFNESFPLDRSVHKAKEIHYYQWVPFLFLAQMGLFVAPKILWKIFVEQDNQLDLNALIELAASINKHKKKDDKKGKGGKKVTPEDVANSIDGAFAFMDTRRRHISDHANGRAEGLGEVKHHRHASRHSVTVSYLGYKVLQLANTLVQFYILNKFLGPEYKLWGYGILKDLWEGRPWQHSGQFPRVTFCDVEIREMGDIFVQHTFQCVLVINMINEKLFIFIWWWLVFLFGINLASLVKWLYYAVYSPSAYHFIRAKLASKIRLIKRGVSEGRLREFVDDYLCVDGVTILRLIEANSNGVTSNIVYELWKSFDDATQREEDIKAELYAKANDVCVEYGQLEARAPE